MTAALHLCSTRSAHDPELLAKLASAAHAIRTISIAALYHSGSGHRGGSLSCADVLACLYGAELNLWPGRLDDPDRDRFVMSKGHAAPALYAAGAHFGFCTAEEALSLGKLASPFQGHPHVKDLAWVETTLGQGFSVALGMAMGLRVKKSPARVYALLGEGELQEDEVWEGARCAAHHKLDNFTAILDYNRLQSDDLNANIMGIEPVGDKFRAFGWHVQEIDGHALDQILRALEDVYETVQKPSIIIAHTIKGKGVPFTENLPHWHGCVKLTRPQAEESLTALGVPKDDFPRWLNGLR